MEAPKCLICEKRHFGACPLLAPVEQAAFRKASPFPEKKPALEGLPDNSPEPRSLPSDGPCSVCGADHHTLADAEKWRRHRAKRRDYMKKRRSKASD